MTLAFKRENVNKGRKARQFTLQVIGMHSPAFIGRNNTTLILDIDKHKQKSSANAQSISSICRLHIRFKRIMEQI